MLRTDINAEKLRELLEDKDQLELIDVRQPDEYEIIHLKGSKSIPLNELKDRLDEVSWNKDVVFLCRTGARSKIASDIAAKIGKRVKNLQYGIYECYKDDKCTDLKILKDKVEGYF